MAKKRVYLVETKSKARKNENDYDWEGLDKFTIPKEITTEPAEKKVGCACGDQKGSEISGGTKAVANEFPWMVRISGGCAGGEL